MTLLEEYLDRRQGLPHKLDQPEPEPPRIVNSVELMNADFPEPRWAIEQLIPEGGVVLAGRPNIGKSWLTLSLAVAVATGGTALGQYKAEQGDVLFIALEDSPRRLQGRLRQLLEAQQIALPKRIDFATKWTKPSHGGYEQIAAWLDKHPDARLVIIDTWSRFRDANSVRGNLYDEDVRAFGELQQLALNRTTAILAITHTTKDRGTETRDIIDSVQHSTGITGSADTIMVLRRQRLESEGTLFATGRDIEECEIHLHVDNQYCLWTATQQDPNDPLAALPSEQRRVIKALADKAGPVSPAEVARIVGKEPNAMAQMLKRMHEAGLVHKPRHGQYEVHRHIMADRHNDIQARHDAIPQNGSEDDYENPFLDK